MSSSTIHMRMDAKHGGFSALRLSCTTAFMPQRAATRLLPQRPYGACRASTDDSISKVSMLTQLSQQQLGSTADNTPSSPAPPESAKTSRQRLTGPIVMITRPLPRVLILHTGGTLGMAMGAEAYNDEDVEEAAGQSGSTSDSNSRSGTGLKPGQMLANLFTAVPELCKFASVDLEVIFNKDSSRMTPKDWITIARTLDANRPAYDAFMVVHGTDTLSYTASALSLMLRGFRKPIILTGSQLPLASPRSDARQNLLDTITCATASCSPPHVNLQEVAICFGGKLLRGNRSQKINSSSYQAFESLSYPHLANMGIDIDWNERYLLKVEGSYSPLFKLDPRVMRIPIVPGMDPALCYGDLHGRGVRGVVLEAFGVGNLPDLPSLGWVPWLKGQTRKGLQVYLASQCSCGPLYPALYEAGRMASELGVVGGPPMTPECASAKMMVCLAHPDLPMGVPLAGEL